jgi:GNAT superfamily N-acetyltransferase
MSGRLRQRWRALVTELGQADLAATYLLHRLLQRCSAGRAGIVPYALMAQPVVNPVLAEVKTHASTAVLRIAPTDSVVDSFPRPRIVNEHRFATGSECYVAWVKGRFAGHIWVARGRYVEDEVRCDFEIADPDACVWDYDVYVEPEFRLGRTLSRLWKAVDETLAAQGVQWTFSRINRFNAGSMRAHQRLGAREVGRINFLVLGPVQLRLGGGAFITISLTNGHRPGCRLTAPGSRKAADG